MSWALSIVFALLKGSSSKALVSTSYNGLASLASASRYVFGTSRHPPTVPNHDVSAVPPSPSPRSKLASSHRDLYTLRSANRQSSSAYFPTVVLIVHAVVPTRRCASEISENAQSSTALISHIFRGLESKCLAGNDLTYSHATSARHCTLLYSKPVAPENNHSSNRRTIPEQVNFGAPDEFEKRGILNPPPWLENYRFRAVQRKSYDI
jgi:hypothetical protein